MIMNGECICDYTGEWHVKVWARSSDGAKTGRSAAHARDSAAAEPGNVPAPAGCSDLDGAVRELQAVRWRYHLAQAEIARLRGELSVTEDARDEQDQRRSALIEAVADSVPSAMLNSRRQGWDEGWEAAQAGFPKSMNPHRSHGDPSPAAPFVPTAAPDATPPGARPGA